MPTNDVIAAARDIQQIYETGSILIYWKRENITFKKGSWQEADNYRQISLTSVLGKTLEMLIKAKIT